MEQIELLASMSVELPRMSGDEQRKWHRWFETSFSHRGLKSEGYNSHTLMPYLQIKLDRNIPLEDQMAIEELLPYVKETPIDIDNTDEVAQEIGIFEYTLCRYGVWKLIALKNGTFSVRRYSWGWKEGTSFNSLKEAMQHIYDEHPYIWTSTEKEAVESTHEDN